MKVPVVGVAVSTHRTPFGQHKRGTVIFADITAGLPLWQLHLKLDAPGNDQNLTGCHVQGAHLCAGDNGTLLRDDQQFAIGVVEKARGHILAGPVKMNRRADVHLLLAIGGHGDQTVDKIAAIVREA